MKRNLIISAALVACLAVPVLSQDGKEKDKLPKPIPLTFCPVAGNAVSGEGVGAFEMGRYAVKFCCENCKGAYAKLEKKEQVAKVAEAAVKTRKAEKKAERTQQATETKLIATKHCVMQNKPTGADGPVSIFDTYEAHFCCDDCKAGFQKLTEDQKLLKISTALASEEKPKKAAPAEVKPN
jgi:hypothetical protein